MPHDSFESENGSNPGQHQFFLITETIFGFDIKRDLATDQFVCLVANNLVDFVVTQCALALPRVVARSC